ncbi:thiol-disulfide isomerase/thioredoxin [Leeuwenhoekiella aestuarii]|uniref:TlpA disulfide reductase family protein n=1 Tax=Leeuwenhoekiella aestuarii TaxID=2249426 RepID=UPI00102608DF|nr:TlpA disulfide reductase family protein [Leeuwenhoekiella aestuarii]RXG12940.1 thiol-disulfide isomerase/thioredoxin [Leeuwenhoekiella aestuarii]
MNKGLLVFMVGILSLGCKSSTGSVVEPLKIVDQEGYKLAVYDFDHFQQLLEVEESGTVRVVNFWATWCEPCIRELPAFEALYADYKTKKVEVILVSLDFPDQVERKLIPFIKNQDLKMPVVFLDDPYTNEWIPKVSPSWSGALPATVIISEDSYKFYERSFDYATLEAAVLAVKDNF